MAQQKAQGTITITDTYDIDSIVNYYLATDLSSGITKNNPSSGHGTWSTSIQSMTDSFPYLWNYEQILGTGNVVINETNPVIIGRYGQNGSPGVGISSIDEYYQVTNSTTNPGSSGWSTSIAIPTSSQKYLWNYQVINYTEGPSEGDYTEARIIGMYGERGERGSSILKVTTAPAAYTTTQGGFTPSFRISLSTVKTQSGKNEVLIGDIVEYNSNHYYVGYVSSSYVYLGAATSIKGDTGATGISITGAKEIYFLKRTTDSVPTAPANNVATTSVSTSGGVWTTVVPDYVTGGVYYTSIQTTYSSGDSPKSSPAVINQGLTDANAKALEAYNSSIARDTEINALQSQAQYFWWDSEGAHIASGQSSTEGDINHITPSTYGYNALTAPGFLKLRYQNIDFVQLATNSLTFYRPAVNGTAYVQGKKAMDLTADALTFYKPLAYNSNNNPTAAAILDSNGLTLSKGGIEAGEPGDNDFIYLSTNNYPLRSFERTEDTDIQQDKDYYVLNNNEFIYVDEPSVTDIANYYEISVEGININGHIPTYINNTTKDIPWRQIIGKNFGVDAEGNLYATGVNISGQLRVTGGNIYTKEETDSNIRYTVDDTVDNLNNEVIYAYSSNSNGINYSYNDEFLQYRGIFVANQKTDGVIEIPPEKHYVHTNDITIDENKIYYQLENDTYTQVVNPVVANIGSYYELIDEEPNKFNWEINPIYAEKHASNYIADFEGGIKISSSQNTTNAYLTLTAMLMQFWLSNRPMAQFGYDDIYKTYGISVENVMITGAGNALRLDNGLNGTYQGQFILETRSNGHLSLKPGLSRTEEEEI